MFPDIWFPSQVNRLMIDTSLVLPPPLSDVKTLVYYLAKGRFVIPPLRAHVEGRLDAKDSPCDE